MDMRSAVNRQIEGSNPSLPAKHGNETLMVMCLSEEQNNLIQAQAFPPNNRAVV